MWQTVFAFVWSLKQSVCGFRSVHFLSKPLVKQMRCENKFIWNNIENLEVHHFFDISISKYWDFPWNCVDLHKIMNHFCRSRSLNYNVDCLIRSKWQIQIELALLEWMDLCVLILAFDIDIDIACAHAHLISLSMIAPYYY